MKYRNQFSSVLIALLGLVLLFYTQATAQFGRAPGPRVESPVVADDGKVTFSILAPKAQTVKLSSSDIPNLGQGGEMTKEDQGVWKITLGPIRSGAYRYNFNVDNVSVIDPRNPATSESNNNTWSLVYVPGAEFMDTQKVPHGAVAQITYYSNALQRFRRMHIYTPPGYEAGQDRYPVFYLLHGASDSDASWTTVGRAGFILDNLIAAGKALPMIVVMPAGHTGPMNLGQPRPATDPFQQDFIQDIMPYVKDHYRVNHDRAHCAIAGLSMGGGQTLSLLVDHMDLFGYAGVFSSGVFELSGRFGNNNANRPPWQERYAETLQNAELKKGLQLLWFATGRDDFLLETSRQTVDVFRKNDFKVYYHESDGGHIWANWREYLSDFAPLLFKPIPEMLYDSQTSDNDDLTGLEQQAAASLEERLIPVSAAVIRERYYTTGS